MNRLEYFRGSKTSDLLGKQTVEVEFNGTNYDWFVNETFIGRIEKDEIDRFTKGFELEQAWGHGLY